MQFSCFCLVHLFCTNLGHMTKCIFPCLVQFAFLQCIITKIIRVLGRIPLVQFAVEFLVQITLHCFGLDQQDPEPWKQETLWLPFWRLLHWFTLHSWRSGSLNMAIFFYSFAKCKVFTGVLIKKQKRKLTQNWLMKGAVRLLIRGT